MKKFMFGVAAFMLVASVLAPAAHAQTATTPTPADQSNLTRLLGNLKQTLDLLQVRLNQGAFTSDQRVAIYNVLGGIRSTLGALQVSLAASAPIAQNSPAPIVSQSPSAATTPAPASQDQIAQSAQPQDNGAAVSVPAADQTASVSSVWTDIFTSVWFWIAVALIVLLGIGLATSTGGSTRTAYASKDPDEDGRI